MRVFFQFDPRGVGRLDSSSGGMRLLGFRWWSTGGHFLQGHGDLCRFFWSAVDLKKRQNRVTFSGFLGWLGFLIPLGFRLGGTFVLWTWGQGFVHSWLWDGAWMVGIWGAVKEQWQLGDLVSGVKKFFFSIHTIVFFVVFFLITFICRYLRF